MNGKYLVAGAPEATSSTIRPIKKPLRQMSDFYNQWVRPAYFLIIFSE